jgi:hypothetical protein
MFAHHPCWVTVVLKGAAPEARRSAFRRGRNRMDLEKFEAEPCQLLQDSVRERPAAS